MKSVRAFFLNCLFSLVAMSRDSKQGKDLKSQRTQGNARRRRNRGEPNWYDRAVNADYQEEVMQIPKDKAGLIIGTKGWRKKEIMEESGVKALNIRDDEVHLKGTEEQCSKAKKIIDRILKVQLDPDNLNSLSSHHSNSKPYFPCIYPSVVCYPAIGFLNYFSFPCEFKIVGFNCTFQVSSLYKFR